MGNEQHDFIPEMTDQEGPQPGPSWGNPAWMAEVADAGADLNAAMDPTQMRLEVEKAVKAASKAAGKPTDEEALRNASDLSNKAMTLVRLYRVRGHLASTLDPLGLSQKQGDPADLTLAFHGLDGKENEEVYVGDVLGMEWTTIGAL
ncbi:MAG: 2-oxoglutarate dehydrogenase E1 component, partial [Pseudomonadota bacterium]